MNGCPRGFSGAAPLLGAVAAGGGAASVDVLVWVGVIVAVVLLAVPVILYLRRRFLERGAAPASPFTMDGLESLRRQGQISDEEFAALRQQVLGLEAGQGDSSSSAPADGDDEGKAARGGAEGPEERA